MQVPADKWTTINEIKEGKKFQVRTDKKIDDDNDIRWNLIGVRFLIFTTGSIYSAKCAGGRTFSAADHASMGFFQRAGILTVLKTSTQLQIWFDDVLEVTWVYEDNDANNICAMRSTMTGLQFRLQNKEDKVSTDYRYEIEGRFEKSVNVKRMKKMYTVRSLQKS